MKFNRWALTLAFLPLSGCFSNDIDIVKKYVPEENPQYSLDQLLTKRKNCSETTWKSLNDDRGRKIVEYACVYSPAKAYLQELTDKTRERDQANLVAGKNLDEMGLEEKKRAVQNGTNKLKEAQTSVTEADTPTEAIQQLQNDFATVSNAASCTDLALDNFKHPQVINQVRLTISECERAEEGVKSSCSRTDKAWAAACNYVRSQAQSLKASKLRDLTSTVQRHLKLERDRIPQRLAAWKSQIQRIEAEMPLYEEQVQKREAENKVSAAKREAESEKLNAWLSRRVDAFKGVTEISQWTVLEGRPVYVGSRVDVAFGDAKVGTAVPKEFVYRNALDNDARVSAFYQVVLDRLFGGFEDGLK